MAPAATGQDVDSSGFRAAAPSRSRQQASRHPASPAVPIATETRKVFVDLSVYYVILLNYRPCTNARPGRKPATTSHSLHFLKDVVGYR